MNKMKNKIKRIDIKEFQEFGFLQEANRTFFHPLGLALEIIIYYPWPSFIWKLFIKPKYKLGGIWDYRDDPEGMIFDFKNSHEKRITNALVKATNILSLFKSKKIIRKKLLNSETSIEPIKKEI